MAAPAPTPCGRQMATAPAGGTAGGITHDSQTEGYYIVSGGGTMFTDGYIVNGRSIVLLVAESHVEKSRIPIGQTF